MKIKKGDILTAILKPSIGSEQGGKRPVVVIQNNVGNEYSPTIIVASITSKNKAELPTHVYIENYKKCGLDKPSIVLLEQIETIDKSRIIKKIGKADKQLQYKINEALITSLDILI